MDVLHYNLSYTFQLKVGEYILYAVHMGVYGKVHI